jgi:hypothetical protein
VREGFAREIVRERGRERERDRERETDSASKCVCPCVCVYVLVFVYTGALVLLCVYSQYSRCVSALPISIRLFILSLALCTSAHIECITLHMRQNKCKKENLADIHTPVARINSMLSITSHT